MCLKTRANVSTKANPFQGFPPHSALQGATSDPIGYSIAIAIAPNSTRPVRLPERQENTRQRRGEGTQGREEEKRTMKTHTRGRGRGTTTRVPASELGHTASLPPRPKTPARKMEDGNRQGGQRWMQPTRPDIALRRDRGEKGGKARNTKQEQGREEKTKHARQKGAQHVDAAARDRGRRGSSSASRSIIATLIVVVPPALAVTDDERESAERWWTLPGPWCGWKL
ncbi:hypothetical protein DFH08DRAFT_945919 [Mycena albidolilacea]|uniref:Uncharacterized protein n=1 Tax=Mycena albidolilacea TaxID=1033008 RepID=A0AAD7E7L2_9AGAR|nr:hypothetical protein DFH08DRAFT_945919 [Mycena albidolilacea]